MLTHLSLLPLALPRTVLLLSSLLLPLLGTPCRVLLICLLFSVPFVLSLGRTLTIFMPIHGSGGEFLPGAVLLQL